MISLLSSFSYSQDFEITDTIFLDKNWTETKDRKEALYYRGALYNEKDCTYLVHDYYLDLFTIQMTGVYWKQIKPSNQIGEFKYYYKNGNYRAIYNFKNGRFHGESRRYYDNGNVESIEKFWNGRLVDTLYYFYSNGKSKEVKFVNPNFDDENFSESEKQFRLLSYWDEKGNQQIINGKGTKVEYYTNGRKRYSIEYLSGFPHGDWIQYNEKKKIISKMYFKNGTFIRGMMYPRRKKDIFAGLYREPRYPGGAKALDEFVKKNTAKCEEALQSSVLIIINITTDGIASFDQIISGNVSHCQFDELQEMVKKMPKWTASVRYGNYVESTYVIRINY